MTRTASLSVAIATRDRPDALVRCLDAVLSGRMLPSEALVIDQSSGDESEFAIRGRAGTSAIPIRYIRQRGAGLSRSRNAALDAARYDIIAMTDDDCVPDVNWVAVVARELSGGSGYEAVTGRVLPLGPEVPGLEAVSSRLSDRRRDFGGRTAPWIVGTGANLAARRQWIARVGSFDVRLGTGSPGDAGEDMDILYRLLRAGARVRYEPDAIVYHERQPVARRRRTRRGYGHGIGACCALWLREGDWYAPALLTRWVAMRIVRSASALRHRDLLRAREEVLVLRGTAAGLLYGARVRGSRADSVE